MTAPDDFEAWLRLLETPGVGREQARRLLAAFGSPEAALLARPTAWREVLRGTRSAANNPPSPASAPPDFANRLAKAQRWLATELTHVLTVGDAAYPPLLLNTADPPLLLYVHGTPARLRAASVAVVGSRQLSPQGASHAHRFAAELSDAGWLVVSGLALGVDAAAHEGALSAGAARPGEGATVAVVGTGPDTVYPRGHRRLAERIVADGGALVTEYAPGTPALPPHFPQRNRIIAGLSHGTLVVEAALRSGSLITARLAAESGREVFAIPGPIQAPQSQGCHALIKQGAQLVETVADILDQLSGHTPPATHTVSLPAPVTPATTAAPAARTAPLAPSPGEESLLNAMGHAPCALDALQARTGWPTATLLARLLELELSGQLARLPGGLYQRQTTA